jgi:uncharacterized membrane protein
MNFTDIKLKFKLFFSEKHSYQGLFLILISAHSLVKFGTVNQLELQGDEAFSVFYSQQSINELLQTLNNEANPPLYYLFLHFWIQLFGIGLVAVKSLNIIISIGTAILLFKLTKKIGNFWFVVFVSVCFLFSNLHFDFSHEIRAFQLVLFLTVASCYSFIQFLETKNRKWLYLLIFINAALPYTHYNAVLVPIVQFIGCLFYWNKERKLVLMLCLGYALSAILFIPQLVIFKSVVPDENFWLGLSTFEDFKYILLKVVGNDQAYYPLIIPYFLSPVMLIIGLRYSWFKKVFSWRIFLVFWLLFILPLLINFYLAQYIPSFQVRYVLFASFGLYLSIGYLFLHLEKGKWLYRSYFLVLMLHFFYQFDPGKRDGEGWKEIAEMVHSFQKRKVAVIVNASYKARDMMYYYDNAAFHKYKTLDKAYKTHEIFPVNSVSELINLGDFKHYEKIILLLSHNQVQDPDGLIIAELNKKYTLCYEIGDPIRAKIRVYNTGNAPCTSFKILKTSKEKSDACWFWDASQSIEQLSGTKVMNYSLNFSKCASFKVDKEIAFSPNREELVKNCSIVDCEIEFASKALTNSILVVSVERKGQTYKRAEYQLSDATKKGENSISIKSSVMGSYPDGSVVKVYVWNPGGATLEIKRMVIQFWKK